MELIFIRIRINISIRICIRISIRIRSSRETLQLFLTAAFLSERSEAKEKEAGAFCAPAVAIGKRGRDWPQSGRARPNATERASAFAWTFTWTSMWVWACERKRFCAVAAFYVCRCAAAQPLRKQNSVRERSSPQLSFCEHWSECPRKVQKSASRSAAAQTSCAREPMHHSHANAKSIDMCVSRKLRRQGMQGRLRGRSCKRSWKRSWKR